MPDQQPGHYQTHTGIEGPIPKYTPGPLNELSQKIDQILERLSRLEHRVDLLYMHARGLESGEGLRIKWAKVNPKE